VTYEQFLEWADEDTYAEWVDGEVELLSPASRKHQKIALYLGRLLSEFEERGDGEVFIAPFQMKLANVRRGREPDVIFVVRDNLINLQNNYLDGPGGTAG
jgi:Uma2 family endonuclease